MTNEQIKRIETAQQIFQQISDGLAYMEENGYHWGIATTIPSSPYSIKKSTENSLRFPWILINIRVQSA